MIKDLSSLYSKSALSMRRSEIRDLLDLTRRPEVISFAGGLPAPEAFPVQDVEQICSMVLREQGAIALQYGPTEGELPLREEIAKWLGREKSGIAPDNILITAGSQQGLDTLGKVLIDPGDIVILELPSYIGALQAFSAYRARMIGVPQDDEGMRVDKLEKVLVRLAKRNKRPKFIYVVPDFQNPSGATLTRERRKRLLQLAYQYGVPVVEDSPYRDLRFRGEPVPPLYSLDDQDQVIVLGTFSKIFCPGLRLAWIMAPAAWLERFIVAKQSMDLCCPCFNMLIAAEYMKRGLLAQQIEKIKVIYGAKCDRMLRALKQHMPRGVKWTKPEGGLFLWIRLPKRMSANELFVKAIEEKVAYVVGSAFHCDGKGQNTMRVNFSFATDAQIDEGIKRLATMISKNMP